MSLTPPEASCFDECAGLLLSMLAEMRIDAHVTSVAPLVVGAYSDLGMRCPHGVEWHAEPTGDQRARWATEGVR